MSFLASLRSYASLGLAIPGYVRAGTDLTLDQAMAQVRARLKRRDESFLQMLELSVFGSPTSPYLPLLRAAGCEFGDIRALVQKEGLDSALKTLRDEGVYITFEEFKGREPVNRNGLSFEVGPDDFSNPRANRHVSTRSSGSTGRPVKTWTSLESLDEVLPSLLIAYSAYGLADAPSAWFWSADPSAVVSCMSYSKLGRPHAWFSTRGRHSLNESLPHGLLRRTVRAASRLGGVKLPKIQLVDPEDALPVARWAESALRTHGRCAVEAGVSGALRVAIAALENGINLKGATITGVGEPPTPAKVNTITQTGARWIPWYAFSEGGRVGLGCANPVDGTDLHVLTDRFALIQHPRQVPGSDLVVDAFNFTTLSSTSPRVLLNVEIDDFGILEKRDCGCLFHELGYEYHLRQIFSFRKLTSGGGTLVGSDMLRIIDEVLPSRFGGSPLDYQLVEEEDQDGFTRLNLVIHPRVEIDDEDEVIRTVFSELSSTDRAASRIGQSWAQRGTLRIKRMEPVATGSQGKIMPLHFSRR